MTQQPDKNSDAYGICEHDSGGKSFPGNVDCQVVFDTENYVNFLEIPVVFRV